MYHYFIDVFEFMFKKHLKQINNKLLRKHCKNITIKETFFNKKHSNF